VSVEVYESIRAVPAAIWDEAVRASHGPVFYERSYLEAYEDAPLAPLERCAYLVATLDGAEPAHAVLPVFVQPAIDPLGALAAAFPGLASAGRGLVTPGWHCYDGRIPATRLDADLVAGLVAALRDLAREADTEWCALVNFAAGVALGDELGVASAPIDERFVLDLASYESVEDYVASLAPKVRQNVRRWQRRAADAGARVAVRRAADGDLDGILELARGTAAKYGIADFYRPGAFQSFVRGLRDSAVAIEVRLGDRLVAGGVCLVDSERFHTWTCGVDYEAALPFSPYTLMFVESVRAAFDRRLPVLEGGRRNAEYKLRYGLRRQPLDGYLLRFT
jgi:CelD/BcsL family acetyltransferase involved in cellulose biosynthesis